MHSYYFWGLHIVSDRAWPELASFKVGDFEAGVDIVIHTRAARVARSQATPIIDPQLASFYIDGVAGYEVRQGREVVVTPEPEAGLAAVQLFLFGSAWGLLCYQRGLLPMHASVAQAHGGAVAICGPSGAGKSTLAAWLIQRGHVLLGDDLCRVDPVAGKPPRVWPSLPRLKLWRATLDSLGQSASGRSRDLRDEDKYHVPCEVNAGSLPLPLRAIYLLEWGPLQLERLTGTAALRQLVSAATYRGEILERMGRLAEHWQGLADVARGAPVFKLSRPREWSSVEAALNLIEANGALARGLTGF